MVQVAGQVLYTAPPSASQLGVRRVSEAGVERRITTNLAAGVVGYSRLMGEDA